MRLHYELCGARGGGDAAARSMYWVAQKNHTFMLVLDSERERNAAIMQEDLLTTAMSGRYVFTAHHDVGKAGSEKWKQMSEEEKAVYNKEAESRKATYDQATIDYKRRTQRMMERCPKTLLKMMIRKLMSKMSDS
ncbi:hypothetical protein KC19_VG034000 [Ceratodon purpureus]|uniref:HMG box domain-containing protein n=1 Tax=Ceratodon purpureus TaxID=3225 RepID=A0A8T0HLJ8_CERPU|nr:hypothetical protein KC19_VG034000 [Ceratodon purpureus]